MQRGNVRHVWTLCVYRLGDGGLHRDGVQLSPLQGVLVFVVTLAISTLLAVLGHRFVEEPAIRAGRVLIRVGAASARRLRS